MDRDSDGVISSREAAGTPLSGGMSSPRPPVGSPSAGRASEAIYVDTHNHVVNRRVRGRFDFQGPARLAMEAMNAAGVKLNLLMPMPSRFGPPNPRSLKANIPAFERLLAHNRGAKIIWVHLGWCNTGKRTVALTRRLLKENPNLYMSIRIASGMLERKVAPPTFPLDRDGRLKSEWLELFQEFPDRFVIGSDEIVKPANDHPSAGSIRSTAGMLAQLPEKLRSGIGWENAYRLYKLGKQASMP